MDKKTSTSLFEFLDIGNRAVKKAQQRNREKGIPNVYSKDGKLVFEYPDQTGKRDTDSTPDGK